MDFPDLIKVLENVQTAVEKGTEKGLKTAGVRVMGTAKAKFGEYQPSSGPYPAWPKLKAATVRQKFLSKTKAFHINDKGRVEINLTRAGKKFLAKYGEDAKIFQEKKVFTASGTGSDSPLIDTGGLRASITVDNKDASDGIVYVGVATGKGETKYGKPGSGYAAVHEFGYAPKNIPPRPYLRPSVYENREEIKNDIAAAIKEAVGDVWRQ